MPHPEPISADQIDRLVAALRSAKSSLSWLLEMVGADSIASMSSSQAVRAMSALQQKRRHEKAEA
jgi:hypothetical protein